jgi:hypothetical protein
MHIFRQIFLSNYWWQKSDIWSQASYRYPILWEAFLHPSDSYFLFVNFVDFYTHWTYMLIFRRIFLSNYWWQKSDIWSQASYRYSISCEAFLDPSDSYFLFADFIDFYTHLIRVITKLPNSVQSYKGKVKTRKYINRHNQSTTGKLWKPLWPWLGTGISKEMVGWIRF